jgi:hypothetical protein
MSEFQRNKHCSYLFSVKVHEYSSFNKITVILNLAFALHATLIVNSGIVLSNFSIHMQRNHVFMDWKGFGKVRFLSHD